MKVFVGITGASGAAYAAGLLRELAGARAETWVATTRWARHILREEEGLLPGDLEALGAKLLDAEDMNSAPASGSGGFDAFAITPCTASTLSKVAAGIGDNLITRAAQVALKERKPLVLLVRETPLSPVIIEAMLRASMAGATVMPACPAFYHKPRTVEDMVSFVVKRVMMGLGFPGDTGDMWEYE